jgi:tRNA dimethylallyltransferase
VLGLQLALEPAEHRSRIAARARTQFGAGLIEEARVLRDRYDPALPAFSAIGYRESWAVIDDELTLEAAIELDAQRNAQFARRQRTWFRRETALEVIDATAAPADAAVGRLDAFVDRLALDRPTGILSPP